ncbi:DUF3500 domain-containing protein [Limnoglobus roseus]|uniref:DUF3500 domain-containing protein n=1 Tax=Limnoglobus roseus TaxID=2598579 RepID=A0A5C1AIU0_9BACT|nr:DUF3500 domain-containing protein [Limnoglobus roseus]QEL17916.1 hypothetical protein PX52LOC_04928 [Limnoglobus roseus]
MLMTRREWVGATVAAAFAGRMAMARDKAAAPVGQTMTTAAQRFLEAMPAAQKGKAMFAFDNEERFNWHFVPLNDVATKSSTREGVPLEDMSKEAQTAALDMMRAGMSEEGFKWAEAIRQRENILAEFEPMNAWYRKPGWYFFTVYGKPAATGRWGWRVEGHHLAVSYTVVDGEVVSTTPFFMGLNPVTIMQGAKKGERNVITPCEDLGRALFKSLDPDQQKVALLAKHLPEVAGRTAHAPEDLPKGLSASKMTAAQQKNLVALLAHYMGRMPAGLAKTETDRLTAAGIDRISFVYTGEPEPGKRHTYAVQGPTFLVHYLNEQNDCHKNPANHIHSIYRSLKNDFGGVTPKA